jgi:hypothetical protein
MMVEHFCVFGLDGEVRKAPNSTKSGQIKEDQKCKKGRERPHWGKCWNEWEGEWGIFG